MSLIRTAAVQNCLIFYILELNKQWTGDNILSGLSRVLNKARGSKKLRRVIVGRLAKLMFIVELIADKCGNL